MGREYPPELIGSDECTASVAAATAFPSSRVPIRSIRRLALLRGAPANNQNDQNDQQIHPQPNRVLVHRLLTQIRGLAAPDLRLLLGSVAARMTFNAKETLIEMTCATLSAQEQRMLDIPFYGSRWPEGDILRGLESPWIPPHVLASALPNSSRSQSRADASASTPSALASLDIAAGRINPTTSIIGSGFPGQSPAPRPYTEIMLRPPSSQTNQGTNTATQTRPDASDASDRTAPQRTTDASEPDDIPSTDTAIASRQNERRDSRDEIEDQIFYILMDAILQAERAAARTERRARALNLFPGFGPSRSVSSPSAQPAVYTPARRLTITAPDDTTNTTIFIGTSAGTAIIPRQLLQPTQQQQQTSTNPASQDTSVDMTSLSQPSDQQSDSQQLNTFSDISRI